MRKMKMMTLGVATLLSIASVGIQPLKGDACTGATDVTSCDITGGTDNPGYIAFFPKGLGLKWNPDPRRVGTLIETLNWGALDPVAITFIEMKPATVDGDGFKFNLDNQFTNSTTAAWIGFTWLLGDANPRAKACGDIDIHPGFAHFHGKNREIKPFTSKSDADGKTSFAVSGGGPVAKGGGKMGGVGFFIHECDDKTVKNLFDARGRVFTLTEIPAIPRVPEPATVALFGAGLVGVAGLVRKRLLQR